jgi:hypothetical protein
VRSQAPLGITGRSALAVLSPPVILVFTTSTNGAFGRPGRPICTPWLPRQRRQRRCRRQASHSGGHIGAIRGPTTHVRRELQLRPRVTPRPRRRLTEVATVSPSRAVDVPSGHRPVLSFSSYARTAFLSLPLLASSLTCQRQQSRVFAGRLHPRGDLMVFMPMSA